MSFPDWFDYVYISLQFMTDSNVTKELEKMPPMGTRRNSTFPTFSEHNVTFQIELIDFGTWYLEL